MKKIALFSFAFVLSALLFNAPCFAEDAQTPASSSEQETETAAPPIAITLKDGSIIRGTLLTMQNNIYTVETHTIGIVDIHASDILNITFGGSGAAAASSPLCPITPPQTEASLKEQTVAIQQQIFSNPVLMDEILKITQDPEIQKILTDDTVVQDAVSMDPVKLQNNKQIQELLNNPQIQELLNKVSSTVQGIKQ